MKQELRKPGACRMAGDQAGRINPKNAAHAYCYSLHDGLGLLLSAALMENHRAIKHGIQMLRSQIDLLTDHYK